MTPPINLHTLSRAAIATDAAPDVPAPRRRWKTRVLLPASILLAAAAILAYAAQDVLRPAIEVSVVPVVAKPAATAAPESTEGEPLATDALGAMIAQAPGWIEPAPYATGVPCLTEGVVREVLVLEGQSVRAGQVIARLIDDDARLQARSAEASLADRQAAGDAARAAIESALAQAQAERAFAAELRDEIVRVRELVAAGGQGTGPLRTMEIRLGGLEARVQAADNAAEESRARLRQAESQLASATVQRDEAKLRLDRTEVRSPADGVVLTRLVEPGARIGMSSRTDAADSRDGLILRIYNPASLQARVDVPLADAARIAIGLPALITTDALPDTEFTGTISGIVHEANIQRNTVQCKVAITKPSPVLKPEMLVRVKLHARATASGAASTNTPDQPLHLAIPAAAISPASAAGEASVWTVAQHSGSTTAHRRTITATAPQDGLATVTKGLNLTDKVILDPPPSLRDGARIRIRAARTPDSHP